MNNSSIFSWNCISLVLAFSEECSPKKSEVSQPQFRLLSSEKIVFNSFVDCNMAEAWIGDTFRIFPGKYGEDPLWGNAKDLKFANGSNADEAFKSYPVNFQILCYQKMLRLANPVCMGQYGLKPFIRNRTINQATPFMPFIITKIIYQHFPTIQ